MGLVSLLLLCSALFVANSDCSMQKLVRARRSVRVQNTYFVTMKDEVKASEIHDYVSELVALQKNQTVPGFKIELHGIVQEVAHGFSAKLSEPALREILNNDKVASVNEDHFMKAGSEDTSRIVQTWGLDRLDQLENSGYDGWYKSPCNLTGRGVDVYILDSGIWFAHREFEGRAQSAGCDPIDQLFGRSNMSGWDCTGHGTHIAGTVGGKSYGVASEATLFSVRILWCNNTGTASSVILGAECVLKKVQERRRPSVVNLSIYGEKNLLVKRALDTLMKKGITVVSIAGNNEKRPRDSCKVAPGSIHGVITASASTKTDEPFYKSNAGACVDLYAPGVDIQSADMFCNTCHTKRRGSSMAAPHVTGAVALLLEKCPQVSPWRIRHLLLSQMVQPNKLNFSRLPRIFRAMTPNLLLHTSSLDCDLQC